MKTPTRIIFTFLTGFYLAVLLFWAEPGYAGESSGLMPGLASPAPGEVQIITTKDGSTIIGRIVEVGENEVRFETEMGELRIQVSSIKKIKNVPASSIKNGQYWYPNPNA